jgi:hypothetical protein
MKMLCRVVIKKKKINMQGNGRVRKMNWTACAKRENEEAE